MMTSKNNTDYLVMTFVILGIIVSSEGSTTTEMYSSDYSPITLTDQDDSQIVFPSYMVGPSLIMIFVAALLLIVWANFDSCKKKKSESEVPFVNDTPVIIIDCDKPPSYSDVTAHELPAFKYQLTCGDDLMENSRAR